MRIARRPHHDRKAAQVKIAVMHSIATPSRRQTIHTDVLAIVIGRVLPAMLCMVLIAFVPGAAYAACPSTRPAFQTLRYEEDYSFLRDPDCRTDVWDRIKYMPLSEAGDVYLSLGGDLRERYEYFHNAQWGQGPQDPDGFLTQRYMPYLDLHLWTWGRFFGQLKSNLESGRTGGPRPTDRDELDAHQVFVDLSLPPDPQYGLTLRAGRQELAYGSQRIISVREGPNVRQSFDAVRGILRYGSWRVDAFVSQPAETNEGIFDDKTDQKRRLWGVYAVGPSPAGQVLNLDAYYLGFRRQDAKFDTGIIAHELRHSLGIRLWGRAVDWDYNLEALYQFGKFGQSEIQAWTAASDIGYTLSRLPLTPRLGLKADIISGDRDRDDRTLGTFNALFPKGAYFGEIALIGPANLVDVHPSIDLRLTRDLILSGTWDIFWRESRDDGIYNSALVLLRSGRASRALFIGHQTEVQMEWRVSRHLALTMNYAHFFAGPFLKDTGPAHDVDYASGWVTYRF